MNHMTDPDIYEDNYPIIILTIGAVIAFLLVILTITFFVIQFIN